MTNTIQTRLGQGYMNPLEYRDGIPRTDPDPYAFSYRGRYYCYSTDERGVQVSVSDDLVTWDHHGFTIEEAGHQNYWAPCVVQHNGTFYMYVSTAPSGSTDPHDERLRLATSTHPLGPFTFVKTFFDKFSIDADVVRDRDGRWYLFYSVNDVTGLESGNAGTSIVVDELVAFDELAGRPRPVVVPSVPEEIFQRDRFGDGRDWFTVEGAAYFTHGDEAFITYSGNAYVRPDYFIGYARASLDSPIGDLAWVKYPGPDDFGPLVRRSEEVEGTGHNSVVVGPDLTERWLMYHGRDADDVLDPEREQRTKRLDRLWIDGARLTTDAPTTGGRAPAAPNLRDQFDSLQLSSIWDLRIGTIRVGDREAIASAGDANTIVLTRERFDFYVAEVDIAAEIDHLGARFGVIVCAFSDDDNVQVLIDAAAGCITAARVRRGIRSEIARAPLRDADPSAFHRLRVERRFDRVAVALDGVEALEFAVPNAHAAFGLVSHRTGARFSGFALTRHLYLFGPHLSHLPEFFSASPETNAGVGDVAARYGRDLRLDATHRLGRAKYAFDIELTGQRDGYAELRLAGEAGLVDVSVSARGVVARLTRGEVVETVLEADLVEPRFTIHVQPYGEDLHLRVAGHACRVPHAAEFTPRRLTMATARLRGLEVTTPNGNP